MFCNGAISAQEAIFVTRKDTFNFSAGPSVLPEEVLQQAQAELLNYHGTGMSVMEMSHRSQAFSDIFQEVQARFRSALSVPDTHAILFLQGGGTSQFSMIPLNLMGAHGTADYAVTGHFSGSAAKEAEKYGTVHIAADTSTCGHTRIPQQSELQLTAGASYFYYCANNTIYGTEWQYVPETGRALAGHELPVTPVMYSYQRMIDKDSMYNTPPCWNIYILGLVLAWLEQQGGVEGMQRLKHARAAKVYDFLDNSALFHACAQPGSRSDMNVTFRTGDDALDKEFISGAAARGLLNLKGHRVAGGMRASLYNAMPMAGVDALVDYLKQFEVEHHV